MRRRATWNVAFTVAVAVTAVATRPALGTQRFGPLQLSGNLQTQNIARTPDAGSFEFIQNRNTSHIRLDYDWLQAGRFLSTYDIPFVESSHLFVLWRGVYDSVYTTTPGFVQKEDIHGRAYNGRTYFDYATQIGFSTGTRFRTLRPDQHGLGGLSHGERDALAFDNQLREAYVDLAFRPIPLTVRAGRQQVVWGETDNFRMLDRVNPLDFTWHFQQEIPTPGYSWDEIRRPLWMLKFLYDLGDIGSLSQSFLEWYWNPGDWFPAKQAFLPRPWGLPFYNPLTNPIDGAFFDGPCLANSRVTYPSGPRRGQPACIGLMNGTKLFEKGNWSRNPMDNSQVGVRYHGIIPQGVEFTLDYFYQRWAGDDGTNYAPLSAVLRTFNNRVDQALLSRFTSRGIFPAEAIAPYVHTVGASANYSDETYTQTVFRFETVYDVGVPFYDLARVSIIDTPALPGVRKKNMWKGMIAFDRPTWIRPLNKRATFFLTGQFFWHYLVNNPSCSPETQAQLPPRQRARAGSCLVGGLDLPSSVRTPGTTPVFRDKVRDWEALATFAMFTFYRGGSLVPTIGIVVDPVNQFNFEPFWAVDWVLRNDLSVNLAQRYFVTPRGRSTPVFESWGLAGLEAGRSETSLRLTYQF
jgi:hypothetical protein